MRNTNLSRDEILSKIAELNDEIAELGKELKKRTVPLNFVSIPNRGYKVSDTHVTIGQYLDYCKETGVAFPKELDKDATRHPVTYLSLSEMEKYAKWVSEKTGTDISLLTEDEYEYCCADHLEANAETTVYNTDGVTDVATKKPNKFGLYDMLGLVWDQTRSSW